MIGWIIIFGGLGMEVVVVGGLMREEDPSRGDFGGFEEETLCDNKAIRILVPRKNKKQRKHILVP